MPRTWRDYLVLAGVAVAGVGLAWLLFVMHARNPLGMTRDGDETCALEAHVMDCRALPADFPRQGGVRGGVVTGRHGGGATGR